MRSVLPVASLVAVAALLVVGWLPVAAQTQAQESATLTVLVGEVAIIRPDGTAVQPAVTGTIIRPGDEIRTLSATGALITLFAGADIQLGADTSIVVDRVSWQGSLVDVSVRQISGATFHRVPALVDTNASYVVEAGGANALVRGAEFVMYGPTPEGTVILVCTALCDALTTFTGSPLAPDTGYWVHVDSGYVISEVQVFNPYLEMGPWNAAFEAATEALQALQGDTDGVSAGQVPAGQREEFRDRREDDDDDDGGSTWPGTEPPPANPSAAATSGSALLLALGTLSFGSTRLFRRASRRRR